MIRYLVPELSGPSQVQRKLICVRLFLHQQAQLRNNIVYEVHMGRDLRSL